MKTPTSIPDSELDLLKECPFCGTKRLHLHEWIDGACVHCECGGWGPDGAGDTAKIMAYEMWNKRVYAMS